MVVHIFADLGFKRKDVYKNGVILKVQVKKHRSSNQKNVNKKSWNSMINSYGAS